MAKLVSIGDSLTQGSMSLATSQVNLSFPAMIADRMGIDPSDYHIPNFSGCGGLPFNLEWMARRLDKIYGDHIGAFQWIGATFHIGHLLDEVEDYWERGRGSRPVRDKLYHNIGVWNFEVSDSYTTTPEICDQLIGSDKDEWLQPPSHGRMRVARRVLNPAQKSHRQADTQLDVAQKIKDRDGKIEHLTLLLGANNVMRTVFELRVLETGADSPGPGSNYTFWSESAFRQEYEALAAKIDAIAPDNVYVGTVPHPLSLPIVKGVMEDRGELPAAETYFDYYVRAWIDTDSFNPKRDRYLNKVDARAIDERVDRYNDVIRDVASSRGWKVVDICSVIDELSWYRNHGAPTYALPAAIDDLDFRYIEFDKDGNRTSGGLVSLDGMHPTTCGYGLMAQKFIDEIKTIDPTVLDIDFADVRRWDSLVSSPPRTAHDVYSMMELLEKHFHFSRWLTLSDETGIHIR